MGTLIKARPGLAGTGSLSVDPPKEDPRLKEQSFFASHANLSAEEKARVKQLLHKERKTGLTFVEEWELASINSRRELSRQRVDRRRRTAHAWLVGQAPLTIEQRAENARLVAPAGDLAKVWRAYRRAHWYPVTACCIVPLDFGMSIEHLSSGKVDRHGVFRCGSVWTCPSCQQRIAVARAKQIRDVQEAARAAGCATAMISFTMPHDAGTPLTVSLARLRDAMQRFQADTSVNTALKGNGKKQSPGFGYVGNVKSTEITVALEFDQDDPTTYHDNGWHAHAHAMYVFRFPGAGDMTLSEQANWCVELKSKIFSGWHRACVNAGSPRPPSFARGLDVRIAWSNTDYIQKIEEFPAWARDKSREKINEGKPRWGIEAELTKSYMKEGRKKSRVPFELLDKDSDDNRRLWREYAAATFGRSQIEWSRGKYDLRKIFLAEDYSDLTDEEAAIAEPEWQFADEHTLPETFVLERADIASADCWRARKHGRNALDRAIARVDGGDCLTLQQAMREEGFELVNIKEARVVREWAYDPTMADDPMPFSWQTTHIPASFGATYPAPASKKPSS